MKKEKNLILKERALRLAKANEDIKISETVDVVEFLLANEKFAIESCYIREVYPLKEITFIPNVPSFVLGVINVRRRIISIIDLRKIFDQSVEATLAHPKTIILEKEEMEFGIFAEEIIGLKKICLEDLQTNMPSLTGMRQTFLKGIAPNQLVVLDGLKLLTDPSLIVQETVEL